MSTKARLIAMNFLQFFVWGAWLITIGSYWFINKQWDGSQFGAIFATMGVASLFMPTLMGIVADRWINSEILYGCLHFLYAICLVYLTTVDDTQHFYVAMLAAMCCYMPTIALCNAIAYRALSEDRHDLINVFPQVRVWGTIGFIAAMWVTNLTGSKTTEGQFYIAAAGSFLLCIHSMTLLPKCPPPQLIKRDAALTELFGLHAFRLFGNYRMLLFFIFSMFLGSALQLTNAYGDVFLSEFEFYPKYAGSFVVRYSTIILSVSQISETLFILAIPFVLKRFGIRQVMLLAMLAWVLRFGLLAFGDPSTGLWMIIVSCLVYGMAFDFFNISGSLFVESSIDPRIRSSAQGLFMMMTNGVGAILGARASGWIIERFYTLPYTTVQDLAGRLETSPTNPGLLDFIGSKGIYIQEGILSEPIFLKDWRNIWLVFAAYIAVIAIAFVILFKDSYRSTAKVKD